MTFEDPCIVVLDDLDKGVGRGKFANVVVEEDIPKGLSNVVLCFTMARTLPEILKQVMDDKWLVVCWLILEMKYVFSQLPTVR